MNRSRSAKVPALIQGGPDSGYPSGASRLKSPMFPIRLSWVLKLPSVFAVNEPLGFADRRARTELRTNSKGVLTFCREQALVRKRSELKIVRSTARIFPLGV